MDLTFEIVGTVGGVANPTMLWFNRKYLDEAMESRGGFNRVGMIWLRAAITLAGVCGSSTAPSFSAERQ